MDGPNLVEPNGIMPGLIPEMPQVRVPDLERIRNARNRRKLQIKEWQKYDRKMMNESDKLQRKGLSPPSERGFFRAGHSVKFPPSLIFLEAAARGDLDEVRKLLSSGVCPDVANEDGLTALHQQMYRFTAEEAAELRMYGISDAQGCCIDNTPEMCRLLLRFGANANARDTERWTPLHAAATCHHTELCSILINNGADLLAMNADGNMPYECCMPGPTLTLIETEMDKRGITQEQLDDLHRLPECDMLADMEVLYKAGADLNSLDPQGASYLHIASACGYEEVAIFLLKHGAKIDLLDRDGWQAIHIAACWDHMEIIEVLVNFGADIMAETNSGETVFDICEDLEMHSRLMELKQELERKQTMEQDAHSRSDKPRELVRRRSSTNTRSASIRRTSMREKKMISWKEAKQEAEMRGLSPVTLAVDAESGVNEAEVLTAPSEMTMHEKRMTSPLTVNTVNSRGLSAPTSPTDRTHSGKFSEQTKPMGLGNTVESSNNSLKLKSPSPTNLSTNGPIRSANGATSPLTVRPPSRVQERNKSTDSFLPAPYIDDSPVPKTTENGKQDNFQKSRIELENDKRISLKRESFRLHSTKHRRIDDEAIRGEFNSSSEMVNSKLSPECTSRPPVNEVTPQGMTPDQSSRRASKDPTPTTVPRRPSRRNKFHEPELTELMAPSREITKSEKNTVTNLLNLKPPLPNARDRRVRSVLERPTVENSKSNDPKHPVQHRTDSPSGGTRNITRTLSLPGRARRIPSNRISDIQRPCRQLDPRTSVDNVDLSPREQSETRGIRLVPVDEDYNSACPANPPTGTYRKIHTLQQRLEMDSLRSQNPTVKPRRKLFKSEQKKHINSPAPSSSSNRPNICCCS